MGEINKTALYSRGEQIVFSEPNMNTIPVKNKNGKTVKWSEFFFLSIIDSFEYYCDIVKELASGCSFWWWYRN